MKRPKGFIPHDSKELVKRFNEAKLNEQAQEQSAKEQEMREHEAREKLALEKELEQEQETEEITVTDELLLKDSENTKIPVIESDIKKLAFFKRSLKRKDTDAPDDLLSDGDKVALREAHQEVLAAKKEVRQAKRLRKRRERLEKRRFTAHSRNRRIRLYVLAGTVLGLATFVVVGAFTPIMAIKNIEVHGAERIKVEDLSQALQPFKGEPIALINETEIVSVLEEFTQIEQFSTHLIPPDTLSVVIIERSPVLAVKDGKKFNLVDAAGIVLEKVTSKNKPKDVPRVNGKASVLGTDEFFAAAQVAQKLPSSFSKQIQKVTAPTPFSVTITLKSGVEVLWGDSTQTAYKLLVLESIIEALDDETVKKIDVSSPKSPVFE